MRSSLYRSKIIIPVLVISIFYNLLWFLFFMYVILVFPEYRFSITVVFLLFYMAIAEPLKDWFIQVVFFKPLYPAAGKKLIKDNRIKELSRKSEIPGIIKLFVKDYGLKSISMVVRSPSLKQFDYHSDSTENQVKTDPADLLKITSLQEALFAAQDINQPVEKQTEIEEIAGRYGWNTVIPIHFKSIFFGFLAITDQLDSRRRQIFEGLAFRIGLVLENDLLTEQALKNQTFKKEFNAARKIEKFLVQQKTHKLAGCTIRFDHSGGRADESPVLFDNTFGFPEKKGGMSRYMIYCKVNRANKRKHTMILFIVSGYFLSISSRQQGLREISDSLNRALHENGEEFGLEGVIVECDSDFNWRMASFGSSVKIHANGKNIEVPATIPLGAKSTNPAVFFEYKKIASLDFSVSPGSKLIIEKNEK